MMPRKYQFRFIVIAFKLYDEINFNPNFVFPPKKKYVNCILKYGLSHIATRLEYSNILYIKRNKNK